MCSRAHGDIYRKARKDLQKTGRDQKINNLNGIISYLPVRHGHKITGDTLTYQGKKEHDLFILMLFVTILR